MKRILTGPHAVTEALRASAKSIETIFVVESMRPSSVRRIEEMAARFKVSVEMTSKSAVEKIARDAPHQGVVAIAGAYPYLDLDGLIRFLEKQNNPLVVMLDQVQDPRNLGAVMRSAYAFGASGILITKDRAASVTAAAVRASAGASELVKTVRVTNLVRALDQLKEVGFQVYGAALGGKTQVHQLDWKGPTVLVLGSEGRGIRRLTTRHCDVLFTIPMVNDFDSLNVSAAASIALFEASKYRFSHEN